jgi:hypothetical protein
MRARVVTDVRPSAVVPLTAGSRSVETNVAPGIDIVASPTYTGGSVTPIVASSSVAVMPTELALARPIFRPYVDDEPDWYRDQVYLQERQEELRELRERQEREALRKRQEREALRETWVDDDLAAILLEISSKPCLRPLARAQLVGRPNAARRRRPSCRGKPRKPSDPPDVVRLGGRR